MLRRLFGEQVDRAPLKGTLDYGDYLNVPWLHEAKNTQKPLFLEWSRTCAKKAGTNWVLMWKPDLRLKESQALVLMPVEKYEELVSMNHNMFKALAYEADRRLAPTLDALAKYDTTVDL